jgi:hypothetical protein
MSSWATADSTDQDQSSASTRAVQAKALDELLALLLSAGYFRARVNSLTAFDKVVGGLCWCITSSGAAVDVDLFYDEELQLGAKIQLAENLVKVLRAMQCPSPLQAHQVQGGDFVAIFPVIRWLVAKVLEYRRITGDYVRLASETEFERVYVPFAPSAAGAAASAAVLQAVLRISGRSDEDSSTYISAAEVSGVARALRTDAELAGDSFIGEIGSRYRPTRRFRRQVRGGNKGSPGVQMTAEARVQSCLLEFGERTVVKAVIAEDDTNSSSNTSQPQKGGVAAATAASAAGKGAGSLSSTSSSANNAQSSEFERKLAAQQRATRAEEEEKRKAAVVLEQQIMQQMTEVSGGGKAGGAAGSAVSGQSLGALMGMQAEELRRAAEEFGRQEEQRKALAESGDLLANTKQGKAAAHARRLAGLQKRVEAVTEQKNDQTAQLTAIEAELSSLREAVTKAERYCARASSEIAKLDEKVLSLPADQQQLFKNLTSLLSKSEGLKEHELYFKASCKEQLKELTKTLEQLKGESAGGALGARVTEIDKMFADTSARFEKARAAMATRSLEVYRLSRLIDEVPSRPELVQYERRFVELFDEVSERLDETRKYYTLYNIQDKKKGFLMKYDGLLASITSNFAPSMKTAKQQKVYLDQMDTVISGVDDALKKQQQMCDTKKANRDSRAQDLQRLVEAQRRYLRAVAEMTLQAEANESLRQRLESNN